MVFRIDTTRANLHDPHERLCNFVCPYSKDRPGFALIIALGAMALICLLLLSLSLATRVELRSMSVHMHQELARQNARFGLIKAISQLQKHAGPDQRVTFTADLLSPSVTENRNWTAVMDPSGTVPTIWLLSGQPSFSAYDSSDPQINATATGSNDPQKVILVGAGSIDPNKDEGNGQADDAVAADRVPIRATINGTLHTIGHYAWWVGDEGVKAKFVSSEHTDAINYFGGGFANATDYRTYLQQQTHSRYGIEAIFASHGIDPVAQAMQLNAIHSINDLELLNVGNAAFRDTVKQNFHNLTPHSFSLLNKPTSGGLKINLSDPHVITSSKYAPLFNHSFHDFITAYSKRFTSGGIQQLPMPYASSDPNAADWLNYSNWHEGDTAQGDLIDTDIQTHLEQSLKPIITEFHFRLGPFHTRSDDMHRIRFHLDLELWNPYPFPIHLNTNGSNSDSKQYYALLSPVNVNEKLELKITNKDTQSSFSVDIADIPTAVPMPGRLDDYEDNSINESMIITEVVIPEDRLDPGELYHIRLPSGKNDGLARTINRYIDKWDDWTESQFYDSKNNYIGTKDAENTIEGNDTIVISLTIPPSGLAFRLIPYPSASLSDLGIHPNYEHYTPTDPEYQLLQPLLELRFDIQNPPDVELPGIEYSRAKSTEYTTDDYLFGFYARLRDDTPYDLYNARTLIDLRQPIIDLRSDHPGGGSLQSASSLYEIIDVPADAPLRSDLFDATHLFADTSEGPNHNNARGPIFLYDFPTMNPGDHSHFSFNSIGHLQHLPIARRRSPSAVNNTRVGLPVGNPWSLFNDLFDNYFYTGLYQTSATHAWSPGDPLPNTRLKIVDEDSFRDNYRQAVEKGEAGFYEKAAAALMIDGGFNINSTSVNAWTMFLASSFQGWTWDSGKTHNFNDPSAPNDPTKYGAALFPMPFNAKETIKAKGSFMRDSDFASMPPGSTPELWEIESYKQGARDVDTTDFQILAQNIVQQIKARGKAYTSLKAFLDDGIIHKGILRESLLDSDPHNDDPNDPDINEVAPGKMIPPYSPAHINQGTIASTSGMLMQTRSDTFIIRAYGQSNNPITKERESSAWLEAVVQRTPNRIDHDVSMIMKNADTSTHGRQFIITHFRWLNREDI